MDAEELMREAIEVARRGIAAGQSPFGCAISRDGQLLAVAHNTVLDSIDITAHAEVNAVREACRATGDILLEGCLVATTCEPCPMCMAALHWARVDRVYFGATIADAAQAGFNELAMPADQLLRAGRSPVKLVADVLRDDCRELFTDWEHGPARQTY